jgi:hypothetical protein
MILTFPDLPINQVSWALQSNTQTFTSPLNRASQTLELPGAIWSAELSFRGLLLADQRLLAAFLVQLRGAAGRFYLADPTLPQSQGSMLGNPVVDLAGGNSKVLLGSAGWTPSAQGVLKAGDMIGFVNDELKMVVTDVNADATGRAVIAVEPPFRAIPTDATSIITNAPTCIMRLSDDNQTRWQTRPPLRSDFSLKCVEAIV